MNLTRLSIATIGFAISLNVFLESKAETFEPPQEDTPKQTISGSTREYEPPKGIGMPDRTDGSGSR